MADVLDIAFSSNAEKWLRRFAKSNPKAAGQIVAAIRGFARTRAGSVTALRGSDDDEMRLRIRTWRVIFRVDERRGRLYVVDLGNRGDVYRRWGRR